MNSLPSLSPSLEALLKRAGWRAKGGHWSHGGARYVVASQHHSQTWERHASALLSQAILLAEARARGEEAVPVAALEVPRATPLLDSRLEQFVRDDLGRAKQAWLVFDAAGAVFAHLPSDATFAQRASAGRPVVAAAPARLKGFNLFSDTNQWLLKVLLAPRIPERLLHRPRAAIRNASTLADAASVSLPTVSRFLKGLEEVGQLDLRLGDLRIADPQGLLQRWRDRVPDSGAADLRARFVRGPLNARGLHSLLAAIETRARHGYDRVLQGLFGACDALGYGRVHGAPPLLYVDDFSPSRLQSLGLVESSDAGGFDVVLRVPKFHRSVFGGAVSVSGVATTDIVQCWLDASHSRQQGQDQADFLWKRALTPLWED